jgi:hypothetical protein
MLQDHGARHRTIDVSYQVFEQQKFFRAQIDRLSRSRRCSSHQIQFQIARAKHVCRADLTEVFTH